MLIALALPLAGLVLPVAPPTAEAAVVKKAKKRKIKAGRPVRAAKVCAVTRVNGRKVTRCRTAKTLVVAGAPVTALAADPAAPAIGQPLPVVPGLIPPPPVPLPPPLDGPRAANPTDYYWIDQADSLAQAFGNSPPDFTFDCDGIDCWAWVSRDGETLIVEPGRQGVQQYFFAPQQSAPYLVRDSYNAFAFDGRELAVVYDNQGQVYPFDPTGRDRDAAEALHERGRALYAMSLRQRRWDRGSAAAWSGSYANLGYNDGWNYGWNPFWRELPGWDGFDREHRRHHPPRHLDDEHHDRDDARRRYDDWHRRGNPGAPPPTGNPVVTPGDGGAASPPRRSSWGPRPAPPPPPRPAPQPDTPPAAEPDPQFQPPLQPQPGAPSQRREIEPEPGAPPIRIRPVRAQPEPQPIKPPVSQVPPEAAPMAPPAMRVEPPFVQPAQLPAPPPPPPPALVPAPQPMVAAPLPAPPPPPPPPREETRTESPADGTDRP